jgi:hypothetical protein
LFLKHCSCCILFRSRWEMLRIECYSALSKWLHKEDE